MREKGFLYTEIDNQMRIDLLAIAAAIVALAKIFFYHGLYMKSHHI